jgi:hypothetical protein
MLPRLAAEESLHEVAIAQASYPEYEAADRSRVIAEWKRQVQPERPTISREEYAARIGSLGMRIKRSGEAAP